MPLIAWVVLNLNNPKTNKFSDIAITIVRKHFCQDGASPDKPGSILTSIVKPFHIYDYESSSLALEKEKTIKYLDIILFVTAPVSIMILCTTFSILYK